MMGNLFLHPVFKEAKADIESLGVKINPYPTTCSTPYAVISGRANARWWLIPLLNGKTAASGLAMFQPTLASARWLKRTAVLCSHMGLTRLWSKPAIYVTGRPAIAERFGRDDLCFAYFTGTDSPHRKAAVQVMDIQGNILGFAKVSRNPAVKALLRHEAEMLVKVRELELCTAIVPALLFIGKAADAEVLVTDTLKTPSTQSALRLTPIHRAFLQELAEKTAAGTASVAELAIGFSQRFNSVSGHLSDEWRERLDRVIRKLKSDQTTQLDLALAHGDFTPWNTFLADGKLYVFDWEYAMNWAPVGIDRIQFEPDRAKESDLPLLTFHYLYQTFRQIERLPRESLSDGRWDGSLEAAAYFDANLDLAEDPAA